MRLSLRGELRERERVVCVFDDCEAFTYPYTICVHHDRFQSGGGGGFGGGRGGGGSHGGGYGGGYNDGGGRGG